MRARPSGIRARGAAAAAATRPAAPGRSLPAPLPDPDPVPVPLLAPEPDPPGEVTVTVATEGGVFAAPGRDERAGAVGTGAAAGGMVAAFGTARVDPPAVHWGLPSVSREHMDPAGQQKVSPEQATYPTFTH